MRVHHLNCATMRPVGGRWLLGETPPEHQCLICHCLLIETSRGLVLVDSGFGTADVEQGAARLGRLFCSIAKPAFDLAETALHQIQALGYSADDVRHVVLTHLDLDHAGGISDFPGAEIHLLGAEHRAGTAPKGRDRMRYLQAHWAHGPKWAPHEPEDGEDWFGFERVRALADVPPEVLLIPLLGHSRGHCGVAVQSEAGWLLHCGDAYFHHDEVHAEHPRCPSGLSLFQRIAQVDGTLRLKNQARLRALAAERGREVTLFSAHDAGEWAAATQPASAA